MGSRTLGIVCTAHKDVMRVATLIEGTLASLLKESSKKDPSSASSAQLTVAPRYGIMEASFTYEGEGRQLKVFFDCDCDHKHLARHSIVLSLACWGHSERIIRRLLRALQILGPTYFVANDCLSRGESRFPKTPLSLVELLDAGILESYQVGDWIRAYDDKRLRRGAFKTLFGVSRAELTRLLALSKTDSQPRAIRAAARAARSRARAAA